MNHPPPELGAEAPFPPETDPLHRSASPLRWLSPDRGPLWQWVAALVAIALVPLLVLSLLQGLALNFSAAVPLVLDFPVSLRFLIVAPLLIAGTRRLEAMTALALRHLAQSELIAEADRPRLASVAAQIAALRQSPFAQAAIVAIVVAGVVFLRIEVLDPFSTWQFVPDPGGVIRSWAGWWYVCASLPLFQFVALTWLWHYLLRCWLLWRISRLDLKLMPTHPDRAGGLGFIGLLLRNLLPTLFALEVLPAALFAQEILSLGTKLADYETSIIGLVAIGAIMVLAPPVVFRTKLVRTRGEGMLEYGALAMEYTRAFDRKWLRSRVENEALIGSADIQSLADMANSFQTLRSMRVVPYDVRYMAALMICAAAAPYLPLSLFMLPLREIVKALLGILF